MTFSQKRSEKQKTYLRLNMNGKSMRQTFKRRCHHCFQCIFDRPRASNIRFLSTFQKWWIDKLKMQYRSREKENKLVNRRIRKAKQIHGITILFRERHSMRGEGRCQRFAQDFQQVSWWSILRKSHPYVTVLANKHSWLVTDKNEDVNSGLTVRIR